MKFHISLYLKVCRKDIEDENKEAAESVPETPAGSRASASENLIAAAGTSKWPHDAGLPASELPKGKGSEHGFCSSRHVDTTPAPICSGREPANLMTDTAGVFT